MVKSLFSFALRESRSMHEAAYLLAAFALGSQLLALVRDRLLAATFGASHTLDLYYAAFRIPDFLFATVASLLSLYALLPVLSRLEQEDERLVSVFLREILYIFFLAMGGLSLILFFLAPIIVPWVAPGISDPQLILLVRILLLQPILLGISNTLSSLTQLRQRFLLYSISPLLYNLGIIFGVVILYPHFGVAGLGWGVVFGALMHVMVQLPFFLAQGGGKKLPVGTLWKDLRAILALSIPRTLALAATQISLLALVAIASYFASGSISVFMFAYNLQAVPLTIIGISYSVAAFPTLARLHARGAHGEFVTYVEAALRHIFFWSIPAMIFIIVLRAQLVRVILGAGAFDWSATRLTAAALALFILSLAAQSASFLIARAYYAAGNTRKPLYWGVVDVVVSVISALGLSVLFHQSLFAREFIESLLRVSDIPGTTVLMLALGYTLGSTAEFVVGVMYFFHDFHISSEHTWRLIFQSFCASVLGGGATYVLLALTGGAGEINKTLLLVIQGLSAGILGLLVTGAVLTLLQNRELKEAISAFSRRFRDTPAVALEVTDISS